MLPGVKRQTKALLARAGLRLERIPADERDIARGYDPRHLPDHSELARMRQALSRLRQLETAYSRDSSPMSARGLWGTATDADDDDLQHFRGDNLYVWQYTRSPVINRYRSFIYARYVRDIDQLDLLSRLTEDGAFGCFTFDFEGFPTVSRDLLDSVVEINFLARHTELASADGMEVLDIGAGYGRLAHRVLEAFPGLARYWCVDAIPQSTFLCEYYLAFRGLQDRSRIVELPEVSAGLTPPAMSLAINVHSFSEMPEQAIRGWLGWLRDIHVKHLLVVPNERSDVLSREPDGSRRDCNHLFAAFGFTLEVDEPVIADAATRDVLQVEDRFLLFRQG